MQNKNKQNCSDDNLDRITQVPIVTILHTTTKKNNTEAIDSIGFSKYENFKYGFSLFGLKHET